MSRKKNKRISKKGNPGLGNHNSLSDGCNKLINENPQNAHAYFIRAQLKYNQGDLQGAVLDLDEFLSKYPNNLNALIYRAVILYNLCEYQSALRDLLDAVLINPEFVYIYIIRGDVYRALGKLQESIDDFDRVIQSSPEEAMAYIGRGDTKSLLHDTEGAKSDYARAVAINPSLITFCPEIGTVNNQELVLLNDQQFGLLNDQQLGLLKNETVSQKTFFAASKITLIRSFRQLKRYYTRFKVRINSTLNCVIFTLVLPISELLSDSVIFSLIET